MKNKHSGGKRQRRHVGGVSHCPRFLSFLSSRARTHISSLSINQFLKNRAAARCTPPTTPPPVLAPQQQHQWREKEDEQQYLLREPKLRLGEQSLVGDRPPKRRRRSEVQDSLASRADSTPTFSSAVIVRKPTCSECPHSTGLKCPFESSTTSTSRFSSRPPIPPRRTSSLRTSARARARDLENTLYPSAPISDFHLKQEADGWIFRDLVQGSLRFWTACVPETTSLRQLMLQLCHHEPCIRHLALANSVVVHQRQTCSGEASAAAGIEAQEIALRHYDAAARSWRRLLCIRKLRMEGREGGNGSLEPAILTSFLFMMFEALRGDEEQAGRWVGSSLMWLKRINAKRNLGGVMPEYLTCLASVLKKLAAGSGEASWTLYNECTDKVGRDTLSRLVGRD